MKVLFITTRLFFHRDSGRKVSLYNYCKGMHERLGAEVYVYSFLQDSVPKDVADKPDFIRDVRLAARVSRWETAATLFSLLFQRSVPLQWSLFYSRKNKKALQSYIDEIRPDVVIVDMIRLAPYIERLHFSAKSIADMDDLLSRRYENMLVTQKMGFFKRLIYRAERARLERAEYKYGNLYDRVIFVSPVETAIFNERIPGKAITVSQSVDVKFFQSTPKRSAQAENLLFIGNCTYAPNADSVVEIGRKIMPLLFGMELKVVGAYTEELQKRVQGLAVRLEGKAEDVRACAAEAALFLCPISYGSGVKTKILEAMAMGLPVITNSIGAEGIEAQDGVHFLVRNGAAETAQAVRLLLSDRALAERIGRNGQALVFTKYSVERTMYDMEKALS